MTFGNAEVLLPELSIDDQRDTRVALLLRDVDSLACCVCSKRWGGINNVYGCGGEIVAYCIRLLYIWVVLLRDFILRIG